MPRREYEGFLNGDFHRRESRAPSARPASSPRT
jgi:hypothetical protein